MNDVDVSKTRQVCPELTFPSLSLSAQEHINSQCRSQYIKAKVNSSHHLKKTEELRDALKKNEKVVAAKQQELAERRQEIVELERTWTNYEKQAKEKAATRGSDIELNEDQVNGFETMTHTRSLLIDHPRPTFHLLIATSAVQTNPVPNS